MSYNNDSITNVIVYQINYESGSRLVEKLNQFKYETCLVQYDKSDELCKFNKNNRLSYNWKKNI